MTKINLELTTKQINMLFQGLDMLKEIAPPSDNKEICDLIRYIDKEVFGNNN